MDKAVATVDVKSAWASKINWTQIVSGFAMVLAWVSGGKMGMTPEQQTAAVVTIGFITNVFTWILRTWFTSKVTPGSLNSVGIAPQQAMKPVLFLALLVGVGLMLGACTIKNPFGGPPLILTGNLQADMPGIQAYAADIRAGVKKDAAEVHAMFQQYCPTVYDANAAAQATTPDQVVSATGGAVSTTAAEKQLGNVQKSTALAATICDGGSATDVKTAFVKFADAAKTVYAWIKAAKSSGS